MVTYHDWHVALFWAIVFTLMTTWEAQAIPVIGGFAIIGFCMALPATIFWWCGVIVAYKGIKEGKFL